jgi:hypothetical protein
VGCRFLDWALPWKVFFEILAWAHRSANRRWINSMSNQPKLYIGPLQLRNLENASQAVKTGTIAQNRKSSCCRIYLQERRQRNNRKFHIQNYVVSPEFRGAAWRFSGRHPGYASSRCSRALHADRKHCRKLWKSVNSFWWGSVIARSMNGIPYEIWRSSVASDIAKIACRENCRTNHFDVRGQVLQANTEVEPYA